VDAAMLAGGHRRGAAGCVVVERSLHAEFVERLLEAVGRLRVGDPLDEAANVGPLPGAAQYQSVRSYLEIARREGCTAACGGTASHPEGGYFIDPTVYDDVDPHSRIATDEILGPVLAVVRARDLDHAVALAHGTGRGGTAAVFTCDVQRALAFGRRVAAQAVHVNPQDGQLDAGDATAADFFTDVKTVHVGP
jgi:betaine-aldehyde dehydrogenase